MLKAVIFDMDGVLVDTEPLADKFFTDVIKEHFTIELKPDYFQKTRGHTSEKFWATVIEEFNLNTTPEEMIKRARPRYLEFLKKSNLSSIPSVLQLINQLLKSGIKIAVASSASQNRIKTTLEIIKLSDKFEIIISADQIKNSKPHPEIYLLAAKTLGVNPKDCIAIEDATNGVKSAKAAGMKVIAFKDPVHNQQDLSEADLIINSFLDIEIEKLKGI